MTAAAANTPEHELCVDCLRRSQTPEDFAVGATLIVLTSTVICIAYAVLTRILLRHTQAWRNLRQS